MRFPSIQVCDMLRGVLILLMMHSASAEYNLGVGIADVTGPAAGITLVSFTIIINFFIIK